MSGHPEGLDRTNRDGHEDGLRPLDNLDLVNFLQELGDRYADEHVKLSHFHAD